MKRVSKRELKMCIGKKAWPSEHSARYGLSLVREKNIDIYPCPYCGKYHLGHSK